MNPESALLSLASHALNGAQTEADELSVYQSLAAVGQRIGGPVAQSLVLHAQRAESSIRQAHAAHAALRDYLQGQLPLSR